MGIKIVIPSANRASRVRTKMVVNDAILCVPKSQVKEYKNFNDLEVVGHPDSIIGLGNKRNWICEHFGDVFMLDDDLTSMRRMYVKGKGQSRIIRKDVTAIIQQTAETARLLGVYLFGFAPTPDPRLFHAYNPFRMTGGVIGCAMGILKGSKLKFNPDVIASNDYYISLLNAFYHRRVFCDYRYSFEAHGTFKSAGGLGDSRMIKSEKSDYLLLRALFGDAVRRKKQNRVTATLSHEYQKKFNLPF